MELCVALDLPSRRENLALARQLEGLDLWLKVGLRTFIRDGKSFIRELQAMDFRIFLDLKLYDIPNTMADAAEEIAQMGIDMFNVHGSAGERGMRAVMERLQSRERRPLVLAVTALTSFTDREFEAIYGAPIERRAEEFARAAFEAGLDGVVSSVFESRKIKEKTTPNFLTLAPGIRPFGEEMEDQRRVADVERARREGVDFIVVGRPVYRAPEPRRVVEEILTKL
ncbi:MAG: orotidine-5'-phosphate decarboxylase [Epsilonproteobacteria bacterium]|nr:orotidine-5'-phosphate decarboxylase [Campylobacterota bacterium]NPA57637.1 orotidine-5'-phosphate decarboxylase [Campylobacterota bacterium]